MKPAPLLVALAILLGGLALAATVPRDGVVALLLPAGDRALPAPPELQLRAPLDGEGGEGPWALEGEARSASGRILDVQYRIDGAAWTSVAALPRGQPAAPFAQALALTHGRHVIEARAFDGDAYSLVERVVVRPGAPTVRVATPVDGGSVAAGEVVVSGTVDGPATAVVVERAGTRTHATLEGVAWAARLALPPGEHVLTVTAEGAIASVPRVVRVAAGTPVPPMLAVTVPQDGAAVGSEGAAACPGCVLFAGGAPGASSVAVTLDGVPMGVAELAPGGLWTWRLDMARVADGAHLAGFRPVDARGQVGVEQHVRFLARTPRVLAIEGDADPSATGTPLAFSALGDGADDARWSLDGEPVGQGRALSLVLDRGGDHILSLMATDAQGRAASAMLPLHALNRAPALEVARRADATTANVLLHARAEDPDGHVVSYLWSFGDGRAERTARPETAHRYPAKGVYVANVTAIDDLGSATTASIELEVGNLPAVANFSWTPAAPTVLDSVAFRDESRDPEGRPVAALRWTFPDGNESAAVDPAFRFASRGEHLVALRAVDAEGVESVVVRAVTVHDIPPAARLLHDPPLPQSGREVLFTDASVDPDGPIVAWRWEFGDGATATTQHALHAYRAPGEYLVNLTVTDDMGVANRTQLPLRVSDAPPDVVAVVADPPAPVAQQEVRLRALAADRDEGALFVLWDFGDGTQANESEPVHRYPRSGLYHGRVLVYDEAGLSSAFPFAIHVANAPPTATLAAVDGGYALYPTRLAASASDPDGAISAYRFDADGDGAWDCEGAAPTCAFTYEAAGAYAARLMVEDDEGAYALTSTLLDVVAPASGLAPPRVRVERPEPGARVAEELLVAGTAIAAQPLVKVELQVRSGAWSYGGGREPWLLAEGTSPWTALLSTRSLPDGDAELVVRATDAAGGVGFARVPLVVANGPRASDVAVRLLDLPTELRADALVHGVAYHPDGVTLVRWRIDEGPWQTIAEAPFAFTLPLDRDALAPGAHTLRVDAYRGLAENATLLQGFVVPDDAPVLVVDEPPAPIAYGVLAAAGRVDGIGRAQWRLDHGLWQDLQPGGDWALALDTLDVPDGKHVVSLRAVSPDGRLRGEVRSYDVEVVNPPFRATGDPAGTSAARQETPLAPALPLVAGLAAALLARRFGPPSRRP